MMMDYDPLSRRSLKLKRAETSPQGRGVTSGPSVVNYGAFPREKAEVMRLKQAVSDSSSHVGELD